MHENNPHEGHRSRLRKKFLLNGTDAMEEHEILELMLYYAIPRKDTNPISHRLLSKFGSISAVLDASVENLKQEGLSENSAIYLSLIPQICRVYMDDKFRNYDKIVTDDNIADKIKYKFIGRNYEAVVLMLLDSKNKEVFCGVISKGSIASNEIYIRKIVELAIIYNARAAVIAHNHPSGIALPSGEDMVATKRTFESLKLINVYLMDHIIVADDDCISLRQSGFMDKIR